MVGRVTELEKLIDTLGFSKERLQGKVNEFQEKYEFNRIRSQLATPWASSQTKKLLTNAAAGERSYLEEFSELEMDRYADFTILSRSMTALSPHIPEVL